MNELMPAIMHLVHETSVLKEKLYQVNFHTTLSGEAMVTLVYHKKLSEDWRKAAENLRECLSSVPSSTHGIVQVSQDMSGPAYCHLMVAYSVAQKWCKWSFTAIADCACQCPTSACIIENAWHAAMSLMVPGTTESALLTPSKHENMTQTQWHDHALDTT